MPLQQIPLIPGQNQRFQITLQIDGANKTLGLFIRYNELANIWKMDISDTSGNPLVKSLSFITGGANSSNLLKPYGYLKLGAARVVPLQNTQIDYPNAAALGILFVLVWGDTE